MSASSKNQAVVVLSGGLDSTVLLHYVAKVKGRQPICISFSYGQKHSKELEFARYWADKFKAPLKLIDLSFMKDIADSSALLNPDVSIPDSDYSPETQQITVVPNRNMIFLAIAIAWAENLGLKEVYYGAHKNDHTVYPDCRTEFVNSLSQTAELGTYNQVRVIAPFVEMQKWQIVKLGDELGVDFARTWSCYKGTEIHCGSCGTCRERRLAFFRAGVKDPTEYLESEETV